MLNTNSLIIRIYTNPLIKPSIRDFTSNEHIEVVNEVNVNTVVNDKFRHNGTDYVVSEVKNFTEDRYLGRYFIIYAEKT